MCEKIVDLDGSIRQSMVRIEIDAASRRAVKGELISRERNDSI